MVKQTVKAHTYLSAVIPVLATLTTEGTQSMHIILESVNENLAIHTTFLTILTPWGRRRAYVQHLALFSNGQVSCPNMAILKKSARISETTDRRAKISSILTP